MLYVMITTAQDGSFTVQPKKTHNPSRVIEFLGVTIDTIVGHLKISPERMQEILDLLNEWTHKGDMHMHKKGVALPY